MAALYLLYDDPSTSPLALPQSLSISILPDLQRLYIAIYAWVMKESELVIDFLSQPREYTSVCPAPWIL